MSTAYQIKELEGFLSDLFGDTIQTVPIKFPPEMPYLYKAMFDLRICEICGVKCVLVIDQGKTRLTPLRIEKYLQALSAALDLSTVYVGFHGGEHHDIQRLFAKRVPFVYPGKQLSIPFLALHLKKPTLPQVVREHFASCEQLIVLGELLGKLNCPLTVNALAERLAYSKPTIQIAFRTLEQLGVCLLERKKGTREVELKFLHAGKNLWDFAADYFINPCKKTIGLMKEPLGVVAGVDALAKRSFLAEQEVDATYAIDARKVKELKLPMLSPHTTPYKLELWHYEPTIFGDGEIDTLSLILSLKSEMADERVAKECFKLIKEMPWSQD